MLHVWGVSCRRDGDGWRGYTCEVGAERRMRLCLAAGLHHDGGIIGNTARNLSLISAYYWEI